MVELAASAGLILDPWQTTALTESMGERPDGKWVTSEVGLIVPRQNGKGSVLEARTLGGMFLLDEPLILWSAHEFKTAREGFLRVRALIDNCDHLRRKVRAVRMAAGEEGIELLNGNRLRFIARSRGSGRGFSGDLVILDEAYALTDEAMAALMPTLSARPNPQIWYTSSAPLLTSTVLRRLCRRGRSGKSAALAYFEWCCDKGVSSDDLDAWAQANPGLGIRLTEEFTRRELDALDDEDFRRERLGIWLEEAFESVIDADAWRALRDRKSKITGALALGFDVTPERRAGAIGVAGRRSDGTLHIEAIDHERGTAWMVARLVELNDKHQPSAILVDDRGPGASLLPALADCGLTVTTEPRPGTGEIIVTTSALDMARACGALYDAVTDTGTIRHLGQPVLDSAVEGAAQRPLGDAWAWSRKESQNDISPLVAVTLAAHGVAVYGRPAPEVVPLVEWR